MTRDGDGTRRIETVGGVLVRNGRILLGRRSAWKSFAGCWDVIGGHVEVGETPWLALCRELREEIAVGVEAAASVATIELGGGRSDAILHIYRVTAWTGEPIIANDEHTDIRWFTAHEAQALPNLALPHYHRILASLA